MFWAATTSPLGVLVRRLIGRKGAGEGRSIEVAPAIEAASRGETPIMIQGKPIAMPRPLPKLFLPQAASVGVLPRAFLLPTTPYLPFTKGTGSCKEHRSDSRGREPVHGCSSYRCCHFSGLIPADRALVYKKIMK
jgi:hypothetical protein